MKAFALTMILASLINQAAHAQLYGETAHWPLDEGMGASTADAIGSVDGTLVNTPTWDTGRFDGCLTFASASSEYVDLGTNSRALFNGASAITMAALVKTTATNRQIVLGSYDGTADDAINFEVNRGSDLNDAGKILAHIRTGTGTQHDLVGYTTADTTVNDGNWHHIAAVCDLAGDTVTIYFDGAPVATTTSDTDAGASASTLDRNIYLGAQNNEGTAGTFFEGSIDDVRVWPEAKSADELSSIYHWHQANERFEWTVAGTYSWIVPDGWTTVTPETWGSGGGGGGGDNGSLGSGGGGGGGAYGKPTTESVSATAGTEWEVITGDGGAGGGLNTSGTDGTDSQVENNSATVVSFAEGGDGGAGNEVGAPGDGDGGDLAQSGVTKFDGGDGGDGGDSLDTGGGGGSSASESSIGDDGTNAASGVAGGTGPATTSGDGGNGGLDETNGDAGEAPGGGGGGGGALASGGAGADGMVWITDATPEPEVDAQPPEIHILRNIQQHIHRAGTLVSVMRFAWFAR